MSVIDKMLVFNNRALGKINGYIHGTIFSIITLIERCYLTSIGIKLSKHVRFCGWTSVFRTRTALISIGEGTKFNSSGYTNQIGINHRCIISAFSPTAELIIGKNCGVSGSSITAYKSVRIGNNVKIGANCVIMDGDFHFEDPRCSPAESIVICDNVWLGYGVVVKRGVTIGENTVIGVNSVVTKDIPANSVAAGTPAKVIRTICNEDFLKMEK